MNNTDRKKLSLCHKSLQAIFESVSKFYSFKILCGFREKTAQDEAFKSGNSRLRWPKSKHNQIPSLAVDAAPLPLIWENTEEFYYFAGYVIGTAHALGINLIWGGDWDSDNDLRDQTLYDLVHFELAEG